MTITPKPQNLKTKKNKNKTLKRLFGLYSLKRNFCFVFLVFFCVLKCKKRLVFFCFLVIFSNHKPSKKQRKQVFFVLLKRTIFA